MMLPAEQLASLGYPCLPPVADTAGVDSYLNPGLLFSKSLVIEGSLKCVVQDMLSQDF